MLDRGIGKIPPQAIDIEKAVLGTMVVSSDSCVIGLAQLNEETFYKLEHQKIFLSIKSLNTKGSAVDTLTLTQELKSKGELELVGGIVFIMGLTNQLSGTSNFETHCLILYQKEIGRKQITLGHELVKMAYDETIDPFDTNNFLNDKAYEISSFSGLGGDVQNADLIQEVLRQIEDAGKMKGLTGIDTGYSKLNSVTGGLQSTELIILAARPAMGKTALALCLLLNARRNNKRVLFFSLEMGAEQLFKRLLSIDSSIAGEDLKNGSLNESQWSSIHNSIGFLESDEIKVIDNIYDISGIVNKSKMERLKNGVDMIVVDYLQLIDNRIKGGSREQEVSDISRKLKLLAKFLKVSIVALSQLSRAVETRGGDKRPVLSDLRESGAIEQDADIVMFLYRAQYYGIKEDENGLPTEGKAELIIAKNRSGSLMNIELDFIHKFTRFDDPNAIYIPSKGIESNIDF